MNRPLDPNSALLAWIVLGRVHRGGVAKVGNNYLDHNRPVPAYLVRTVDELISAGLLALADPDPVAEATRRVAHTPTGQARYVDLCQQQRAELCNTKIPVCRRLGSRSLAVVDALPRTVALSRSDRPHQSDHH